MKFSPPPSTVTLGSTCRHPISRPFRPRRPTAASLRQGRAAAGQGPHSAHTETGPPPLFSLPGPAPTCPSRFFPLLDRETVAPPHGAPITGPVVAASSSTQVAAPLLSLTVSTEVVPNQAPEAGRLLLLDQATPTEPPPPCRHARLSVYAVTVSFRSSEPGQDPKLAGEQLPSLSSSHTPLFPSLCSLPMRKTKTEGGHRCHAPELAVSQSTACWCRCSGEHLRSRPCSECSPHLPLSLTSILAPVQPRELAAARHSFQQPTCAMATPRRQ
jgi:hypothetical protein